MDNCQTMSKDCVAHQYWSHMDDHEKSFFKCMIGDFRNVVTIPEKFTRNFRGKISETVKLETRNGNTYNVQVVKEQNNLVLQSGWAEFARTYELKEGDILVFIYSGESCFKVRIFDPSACEKELSCMKMNHCPHAQEKSIPHDNHAQSRKHEGLVNRSVGNNSSHSRKTSKINPLGSPSRESTENVPPSEESVKSGDVQKPTKSFYDPRMSDMLCWQKAEVDALEQKIQPRIPFYITAMDKTSVTCGFLAISKDYADKYQLNKNETITLCQTGGRKTWDIKLNSDTNGQFALSTGWLDFIRDNHLQEGDICVFEASEGKRGMTLTFHPCKEWHHSMTPGYAPSIKSPSHGLTKLGDCIVTTRHHHELTDQQKRKVEETVQAIQSEIPLFLAVMELSSIGPKMCVMAFNMKYATKYLPHKDQTIRLQLLGKNITWEVEYHIMEGRRRLVGGWKKFVGDNNLKLEDICLFQLMKDAKEPTMMVHII